MRHISFVGLVALLLVSSACSSPPRDVPRRPNIVLVIGDDHGWPYYGFMGSDVARTPNLDALAAEGTVFPYAYNTASVCRPSLRSILTGLYPHQFELHAAAIRRRHRGKPGKSPPVIEQMLTLPRLLGKAGYRTYQAGKLWDGTHGQVGFAQGMTPKREDAATEYVGNRTARDLGRKTLEPVFSFLREKSDQPFFLWFAPQLPHVPFDAPAEFEAPYRDLRLGRAASLYFANCIWEDHVVGRLLDFLAERGLEDSTLVIYLSDNGWEQTLSGAVPTALGGPHGKGSMHEMGFRTPLIFRWPGEVPAGRTVDARVSTVDLFPTLLRLAGAPVPPYRNGIDLGPTILGGAPPVRDVLIGGQFATGRPPLPRHYVGDAYYLRDDDWYYVLWGGADPHERLYDKRDDAEETVDVAAAHPDRTAAYRERVLSWLDEIGVGRKRFGWSPKKRLPGRGPRRRRGPPTAPAPAPAPTSP